MKNSNILDRYISTFEGEITECRRLYDHFIVFDRGGTVISARTHSSLFSRCNSFYDVTDAKTAGEISRFSISFEKKWLIIDTTFGKAAVFNSLFPSSGLLFAIIFTSDNRAVSAFFEETLSPYIASVASYDKPSKKPVPQKDVEAVRQSFTSAELSLSHQLISSARYKTGTDIGRFLAEHLLSIAYFIGCTGACRSELDTLPSLDSLSPELFVIMSCCAVMFARNNTPKRHFKSKLINYKNLLMVSFAVDTDKKTKPYDSFAVYCENLANSNNAYFSYFMHQQEAGRLIFSFLPQSAPDMGSHVKQELEQLINDFWADEE